MQDAPNLFDTPLKGLKKNEWLQEVATIAAEHGNFYPLDKRHAAVLIEPEELPTEGTTLLVTFETLQGIQTLSDNGQPMGWDMVRALNWSHLSVVSDGDTWFRSQGVYGFFDRMIDDGFFEDFDNVLFYGAGPCGYAACAYSVAAPGATVLAVQPQATLDPRVTEWDDRFVEMRRMDFTSRYGYAPDMLDAANHAFVVYDPAEQLDAMHAALFTRTNVTKLRMRHLGDAIQSDLVEMQLLYRLLARAGTGKLTESAFAKLWRKRRDHPPYLRKLLATLDSTGRPYLSTLLCRNVTARMKAPRIQRRLDTLLKSAADGHFTAPPAAIPPK
ncbi:MAG: phosphoadenosine phosphosulfate reductase [Paracoccaceae bacterium]